MGWTRAAAVIVSVLAIASCGGGGGGGGDDSGGTIPAAGRETVVFAWNDLGMHCLNPTYDKDVILPPYNTVWAQAVRRGNPPRVLTDADVIVEYRIVGNTSSADKGQNAPWFSDFGQFWANVQDLFGVALDLDKGLNLVDPDIHNGLSGTMLFKQGDHFEVDGIPLTPIDDSGAWNPLQVIEVTVKDKSSNAVVAQTLATVPTSDEIRCAKCHGVDVENYLSLHDADHGTTLASRTVPFLCAECHASPALGMANRIGGRPYLSEAVHAFHGNLDADQPVCYDCHPGELTQCNRSLRHTAPGGNCEICHGTLANVGTSITDGRMPWADEPKCATCHGGSTIPEVDTGTVLYRNARGHGGLSCPACHGSPHAMVPSREASDNYQAAQYQGRALSIGSCAVCHADSHGEGAAEFAEEHGSGGRPTACSVCHTSVSATPTLWPHDFKWIAR